MLVIVDEEIVKEFKPLVGLDQPVCARLSGAGYHPDGRKPGGTGELSECLRVCGVRPIRMSGENRCTTFDEVSPVGMSLAHIIRVTGAVKKVLGIPVIGCGFVKPPDLAKSVLVEGKGHVGLGWPRRAGPQ